MTSAPPIKVLLVDDEYKIVDTPGEILKLYGFSVAVAYSGFNAIDVAKTQRFDVLISDAVMPGMDGIRASEEIRKLQPGCKVILFSGNLGTQQLLDAARNQGIDYEILAKPVHPTVIIEKLRTLAA